MLQSFPAETAVPRVKKEPPKLEGFYSEKARALDKLLAKDKELAAKQAAAAQKASDPWGLAAGHAAADALRRSQLAISGLSALRRSMAFAAPVLTVLAAVALAAVAIASWRAAPVTASIQVARESTDIALPTAPGSDIMLPVQAEAVAPSQAVDPAPAVAPTVSAPLPVEREVKILLPLRATLAPQAPRASSVGNPVLDEAQPVATSLQARLGAPVEEPPPVQTPQPARVSTLPPAPTVRLAIDLPAERLEATPIAIAPRPADPTPAIRDVIRRYEAAYERLDASAAKDIWPSLDERALARAFAGLSSQTLTLEPCNIDVNGSSAVASCRGFATYVGRVGNKLNQVQRRDWTFELHKSTDNWQIRSVRSN